MTKTKFEDIPNLLSYYPDKYNKYVAASVCTLLDDVQNELHPLDETLVYHNVLNEYFGMELTGVKRDE